MSLPVRLMFGNNALTIPVQAEEITMAVHRKVHAFPVPFSDSQRIGIDTNMASLQMNMSLILADDKGTFSTGASPLVNMISFASYPTDVVAPNYNPANKRIISGGNFSAGDTNINVLVHIPTANVAKADIDAASTIYDKHGLVGTKSPSIPASRLRSVFGSLYRRIYFTLTGGGLARKLKHGDPIFPFPSPFDRKTLRVPLTKFTGGGATYIELVMQGGITSNRAGGAGTPSVRSGFNLIERRKVIIDVPVGGIDTNPDNGNPAKTLALVIKDALELTTVITNFIPGVDGDGGRRVVDAFDVTISPENDAVLIITQKYVDDEYNIAYNSVGEPNALADTIMLRMNQRKQGNLMSAGDKAQTLMGLFANADSGDVLRGIQIPYDSLIQSDAVTPEVRNFFTTYGRTVRASHKTSEANTLPSSQPMLSPSASSKSGQDILDEAEESSGTTLLDKALGLADDAVEFVVDAIGLGDLYDGFKEIVTGIGDALSGEASEGLRTNGIYVLPENFHLRKEAALNYYVADLDLIMVHKVAGA